MIEDRLSEGKRAKKRNGQRGKDLRPRRLRTDCQVKPGTGRKQGSKNNGLYGSRRALKTLHWRVPADAPKDVARLADKALDCIVDIMRHPRPGAADALKAAAMIREEICGAVARRLEVRASLEELIEESYRFEAIGFVKDVRALPPAAEGTDAPVDASPRGPGGVEGGST